MKVFISIVLFTLITTLSCTTDVEKEKGATSIGNEIKPDWTLVLHGGAGTIRRENMTSEQDHAYRAALDTALNIGAKVLAESGSALDAVEETIRYLEDNPLFNAGKGAVFTHAGTNELDASIMDGSNLEAGAVAGVSTIRHPISAARKVMEASPHVMLSGAGAVSFASTNGLEIVDPAFFYTERRYQSLQRILEREKAAEKHGTVGVVALDQNGNLAAGTSTGGMTNKRWGRIGDSPIIGAGTYANNKTCAISCTGHGEYFIRYAVAHSVSAAMEYGGKSLETAANDIINGKLSNDAGSGGLIGLDARGNITMPFNSEGMYRGYIRPDTSVVLIYKEEG